MIEKLYHSRDMVDSVKAVTKTGCNRCNGHNIYQDVMGQYFCLDCFEYGEINDSMMLYRYRRELKPKQHYLNIDYELSDKQRKGSDFLLECYHKKQNAFLQAVCGAGKTEMCYAVILAALNDAKRVCLVIPRVAVIKELHKRLKQHFNQSSIGVLYEGKKQYAESALIVSTPQQLIYFYQEFDLVIVDEVDAFPFAGNIFLSRILQKSLHPQAVVLYMSATITKEYQNMINKKHLRHLLIPSRFHGEILPVPEFRRIKSNKQLVKALLKLVEACRQTLVFVPTIEIGKSYQKFLSQSQHSVRFISSNTKDKLAIIDSFRRREYRVLICTTILERGVTFTDIDCVVMMSDHKVFTKASLVQIAGRVGRTLGFTEGSVIFYSQFQSSEMKAARKEILWMNKSHEMPDL